MKAAVDSATLVSPAAVLTTLKLLEADFKAVGKIADLIFEEGDEFAVKNVVMSEVTEED
jgi:valyl-tRNA synthetase